jgi:nucleoside-diphosphate-sugar epimerase
MSGRPTGEVTLVTGATGFLGQAVLRLLAPRPGDRPVVACVRREPAPDALPPRVPYVVVDLAAAAAPERLAMALTGLLSAAVPGDAEPPGGISLVHLAGDHLSTADDAIWSSNVQATLTVLEALGDRLSHAVYASSVAVYGNGTQRVGPAGPVLAPDNAYGRSKWLAEWALELFTRSTGRPVAVLRLASLYGRGNPGRNAVGALTAAVAAGQPFTVRGAATAGRGVQARDYLHVDDAARAVVAATRRRHAGTLDVGTGVATSPVELVDALRAAGERVVLAGEPAPVVCRFACDPHPYRAALGVPPPIELGVGLYEELAWRRAWAGAAR